ncbi:MAG: site-2 protease family protein, partial [Actinomycetota bacterium]|nr:site-2 protease family protein [Actinomycetota bacterium]
MREHVRLGRIAGIAVGFNWTLLLIAGFLALGLGGSRFPVDAPGYSKLAYGIAGVVTALAFLGGLLAHELSHALVARREGLTVDGIVLWLMGGYTRIGEDPKTPGSEFRISAAGPFMSLLVGIGCGLAALVGEQLGIGRLPVEVLVWLGSINILLAVFNMLPGAPLDGIRAADVMAPSVVGPGWFTVDAFLREFAAALPRPPAFLVEQWGGGIAGLVPTTTLEAVPVP